jgi:hypothetical protein
MIFEIILKPNEVAGMAINKFSISVALKLDVKCLEDEGKWSKKLRRILFEVR